MQKLNTTPIYILSVVGFICCCAYGIGTIAAVIAVYLANKGVNQYNAAPELYSNGPAMKTAKTVAIISLVLSLIGLAFTIYTSFVMDECEVANKILEFYEGMNVPEESYEAIKAQYPNCF